ncbi:tyrosine-type recombinase/integrase [Candidatus Micrarchaeota archaeon]|nr:tyrosine-type recombinase/integrase [Candidatus Micrarchaeota archaeon]
MVKIDLYNYPKRLEGAIDKVKKLETVSEEDKQAIISFSKVRLAKGSSHGRVAKVVYCMRLLATWLKKPFRQATKDDLIALVGDLEANDHYAEHTKYDYKIVLKMFYKWLLGNDEEFPAVIKWLKPDLKNENHKLPEELLTEDEVLKIAEAAENPRDKAIVLVLYEAGCRIGELLTVQMKNVQFDQYGAVLRVTGKTGDRRIRIISSASVLSSWVNLYPNSKDPNAPLWPSTWRNKKCGVKCLSHGCIYETLRGLAVKAGVKKRIYPHLFRHSRATSLAGKLTEAQMKEYFGWVQGSDMAATYVHLSGRDVDNALLKLHGLAKPEDEQEDKMRVRICQRCKEHNSPISKFCIKCGLSLDDKFLMKIEKEIQTGNYIENKLWENEEYREYKIKMMVKLGLDKELSH